MEIKQRIISKSLQSGLSLLPECITIHETDNIDVGADAEAHAKLQERGNDRDASWHLQIDDQEAIQSVPFNVVAWAAGDGKNGPGNRKSIHIEMCVNSGSDYKKTVANTAEITRRLMSQFNIPIDRVVQHNKWSGKNCPRHLRAGDWGICWADFINLVKNPSTTPYKVIIPNTAFWQAKNLVIEFEQRGLKCYGVALRKYGQNEKPVDKDPYQFVIETDLETAKWLVIELKTRGYDRTFGQEIK